MSKTAIVMAMVLVGCTNTVPKPKGEPIPTWLGWGASPDNPSTAEVLDAAGPEWVDAYWRVIDAWDDNMTTPMPDVCTDVLGAEGWTLVEIEQAEIGHMCHDDQAIGCTDYESRSIAVAAGLGPVLRGEVIAHEITHHLQWCVTGFRDPEHADPAVWGDGGVVDLAVSVL